MPPRTLKERVARHPSYKIEVLIDGNLYGRKIAIGGTRYGALKAALLQMVLELQFMEDDSHASAITPRLPELQKELFGWDKDL